MRQWWGMRRRGHTLSSKTQLVANDTTFSARGPGLRLQTRGRNGLNYGLNGVASRSCNKDTHHRCAHSHMRAQFLSSNTEFGLKLTKTLHNVSKILKMQLQANCFCLVVGSLLLILAPYSDPVCDMDVMYTL